MASNQQANDTRFSEQAILNRSFDPTPGLVCVQIVALDTASGNYYPVTGSFDSNGNFVLNTSGSGVSSTPAVSMVGPWLSLGLTNIEHS